MGRGQPRPIGWSEVSTEIAVGGRRAVSGGRLTIV
jgi:hypothetical protein